MFGSRTVGALDNIACTLREILALLRRIVVPFPAGVRIVQLGDTMAINGVQAGGTGTFEADPTPVGSAFPAGTTFLWSSSDSATSLTPSTSGQQVAVAVAAGDTNPSFTLTVTVTMPPATPGGTPTTLTANVTVPITQPTPPAPTGVEINQIS